MLSLLRRLLPLGQTPSAVHHNELAGDVKLLGDSLDAFPHCVGGLYLKEVALTSGVDNEIAHTLGRKWVGWTLIRKRGAGDVYEQTSTTRDTSKFLVLRTSTTVTVDLLVW